jgi:N-methylhydantoinase A
VTDANLVLGRLDPDGFLGGRMRLDEPAAWAALDRLARAMGVTTEEAAAGVVRLADEQMTRALRVISVQRGLDPRAFILTSFGGAGGLHVCALAEGLAMTRAMVPVHAGVLSALGMLVTPAGRTLTRTRLGRLDETTDAVIAQALDELAESGIGELIAEGLARSALSIESSLDLRYLGQLHTLNLPWSRIDQVSADFHRRHEATYGHRLELPVELVSLRVRVRGPRPALALPSSANAPARGVVTRHRAAVGCPGPVPILSRHQVGPHPGIAGPAIITDALSTTWLAPAWRAHLDELGNLLIERPRPDA